jgi:ABC exporter membrane fusion protein, DevB family
MRTRLVWVAVLLLSAAGIGTVIAARFFARGGTPPAVAASSSSSEAESRGPIVAAGRVEPAGEEFKIGSELDGRLARVLVNEGDRVRAGQVVAELVNDEYRARVELARAEVAERQARLDRLRAGSRIEEVREAEAALLEAEARLATAHAEVERRRPLLERGAISRSEFDLSVRDEVVAGAAVAAARERLELVRHSTRAEDIRRTEAELASSQARLREAEAYLAKTFIKSPIHGRVLRRWLKSGESVTSAGGPILSIGNVSVLRVRVDVDETDVARIRIGQPAYVTAEAYGDKRFTGKVVQIGQALGRKNIRTDEPTERVDKKILETLVELDKGQELPIGLRVDAYLQ